MLPPVRVGAGPELLSLCCVVLVCTRPSCLWTHGDRGYGTEGSRRCQGPHVPSPLRQALSPALRTGLSFEETRNTHEDACNHGALHVCGLDLHSSLFPGGGSPSRVHVTAPAGSSEKLHFQPSLQRICFNESGVRLGGAVLQSLPEAARVLSWDPAQHLVTHRSSVNRQEGRVSLVTCPGSQTLCCRWLPLCARHVPHLTGLTRPTKAPGSRLRDRTAEALEELGRLWGTV